MVLSMDRWVGKIAIVTGASSGIGKAIAAALVHEGFIVVGVARRVENINQHAKKLAGEKGKLYGVKADLTQEQQLVDAFKWVEENLGPVHVLVNNAGTSKQNSILDGATNEWKEVFDINVLALCVGTREAVKSMRANNINGHIIHINSIAGHTVPNVPALNVYGASKHAVTALTETLRQELNRINSRIRITSVSPGLTISEMTISDSLGSERKALFAGAPILQEEDIADGVIYVLSTPEHVQVHELTIKPLEETF